jgi:hypothetical protein
MRKERRERKYKTEYRVWVRHNRDIAQRSIRRERRMKKKNKQRERNKRGR